MKNLLAVILVLFLLIATGCSHNEVRTKWTDPSMRVFVMPDGIDANNYVRIQSALVSSGKWIVIERSDAFERIKQEQEMEHRSDQDRFQDEEKFALYGRLLGVGGVVVAHSQCASKRGLFGEFTRCRQSLSIVNTVTGEVIMAVEGTNDDAVEYYGAPKIAASWEDTVNKLNDAFPENFEAVKWNDRMKAYKQVVKEESLRQKESHNVR